MNAALSLYRGDELFLAEPQLRLLRQVEKDGSIRTAAQHLHLSYPHAWHLLDTVNRLSPVPVVVRYKGGKEGGGCRITPYGIKLMAAFERHREAVARLLETNEGWMEDCFF
jgi:molybdate transport system regulatory protein